MAENPTAYPLYWPAGWKRTKRDQQKRGEFETHSTVKLETGVKKIHKRVSTYDSLERIITELERMGVDRQDVIVSTNIKTRLDGLPYSGQAEPEDVGVAVYWRPTEAAKTQCMAIDRYDRVADNIAAIALTLAYMRGIERHGGAEILDRAFTGFTALPPPIETGRPWWDVLGFICAPDKVHLDDAEERYRNRAKLLHPDLRNGDHGKMAELNEAIRQAREALR